MNKETCSSKSHLAVRSREFW